MASVANDNGMATPRLLRAVARLSWDDFPEFLTRAIALQHPPPEAARLSRRETGLLLKINAGPPAQWQRDYNRLIEKRRGGRLTVQEQRQLLKLSDKMERYVVRRLQWL